jgi:hypothetical protein
MSNKHRHEAFGLNEPEPGTALVPTGDEYIAQAVKELQAVDGKQIIDEAIKELNERYANLTVSDLNDRPAYIAAKDGAKLVKGLRTGVETKRKELKEFPLKYGRAVDAEAKRITELLTPIESHLKAQVDKYEKAEEEAKKADMARKHTLLLDNGWQFTGQFYVCGPISMTPTQAMELSDERLEKALDHGLAELQRQAAEKQRREEEAKRQAEEAERLRKEQEALREEKKQMRMGMMAMAGAPLTDGWFVATETGDRYGAVQDIVNMEPSQFTALVDRVVADIAAAKEAKSQPAPVAPEAPAAEFESNNEKPLFTQHVWPDVPAYETTRGFIDTETGEIIHTDHSAEYIDGYEHCRQQVLAILADPTPRRKSDIVELVNNLRP